MSLLRKALEGEGAVEQPVVTDTTTPVAAPEEKTVVMSGPLSQVYTQALAIAFQKPTDQVEVGTTAPEESVAMETQANDAIMAQNAIRAVANDQADFIENPQALIYGVSADAVSNDTIVDVATQMSDYELDQPEEFIVVIDATDAATKTDAGADPMATDVIEEYRLQLNEPQTDAVARAEEIQADASTDDPLTANPAIPVLESLVTRMGGRVVYSLKSALEALDALKPVELSIEDELEPENVKPAKKEDGSDIGVEEEKEDTPPKPVEVEGPDAIAPAGSQETEPAVAMESNEETEELHRRLRELQDDIEKTSPANRDRVLNSFLNLVGLATESDKPGKKDKPGRPESPTGKLSRASSMLMALVRSIKDKDARSELYHINGIINSAKKDLAAKK